MPPKGERLTEQQSTVRAGSISSAMGGNCRRRSLKTHWSFKAVARPKVPKADASGWGRNAVDHFIAVRFAKEGLKPTAEADRPTLIRRLYFDLLGLPPTPEEVEAFVEDRSPNAYEELVDRYLGASHYRRALGAALARCRALRREPRLRDEPAAAQCLALSRLRHSRVQRGQAVRPIHPRATRGRCPSARGERRRAFSSAGATICVKGNPP